MARGSVTKRPNGGWRIRWYGSDRKQHELVLPTKRLAEQRLARELGRRYTGEDQPDAQRQRLGQTPFSEVASAWLATKTALTPKTRAGYDSILSYHLLPAFGDKPIRDLTAADVDGFISGLQTTPTTRRNVLRVIGYVGRYAVKAGMIEVNPIANADRPKVVTPNREDTLFLTAGQVAELAGEVGPDWSALVYFAAYTGLRAGEIVALRVRHIDLMRKTVRVEGSITDVNGHLTPGLPKSGRARTVTMPRFLVDMMTLHVAGKPQNAYVWGDPGPMRHGAFYSRKFKPAVARLVASPDHPAWTPRFAALRFHDLRHTSASLAIHLGAGIKVVQERLGHSSITVTMDRYSHLYEGHDEELLDRMDEMFSASRPGG